jgi:ABC-type multidrug transport system ATPase subunit
VKIEVEDATVKFGRTTVLDLPKLSIGGPNLTVLTGPNGAGKSTLLRLCAGLLRPDSGTVTVDGAKAHRRGARLKCGYSPDHPVLFDDLTIADNIAYAHESSGSDEPAPLGRDLVTAFGLEPLLDRFPSQLSRGQRQAASLVVASSRPVAVLLYDEPTLALDADNRSRFAQTLARHADDHLFVVATHETAVVEQSTGRVDLKDGRVA